MHGTAMQANKDRLTYRPEIDGLRALAVVPVILFHAGFPLFSGGYVGVDVFFVISGYLITSIIVTEKEAGTFSLAKFYERRARRILPALFIVMFACLPFAWLFMAPGQLKDFAKSVLAMSFFSSNFFFWLDSGYFTAAVDEKPLLHTWSLAVEEQYYLLFPVLMLAVWPLGKRWLWGLILLAAVGSLGLAELGWRRWPEANFYLLHARAWELAVGALAALYLRRNPPDTTGTLQEVMSGLGIVLIIGSAVTFTAATPFPSAYATIPVAGALAVILYATPKTVTGRLLTLRAVVGLGLISYGAYLWHQPLFAFYRILSFDKPSLWVMSALVAISIGIAYLSWRFVETWARQRASIRAVVIGASASSLFFAAIGLSFSTYDLSRPFTTEQLAKINPPSGNTELRRLVNCGPVSSSNAGFEICSQHPALERKAVLYGDSHAATLYLALSDKLAEIGVDLIVLNKGRAGDFEQCQRLLGSFRAGKRPSPQLRSRCVERSQEMARIANSLGADHLFISFRWTFELFPAGDEIPSLHFDNGEGGVSDESYREYFVFDAHGNPSTRPDDKYSATLEALMTVAETFKGTVVLIGPVPEVGWRVADRNRTSITLFGQVEQTISTSFERFRERNRLAHRILEGAALHANNVSVTKPEKVFCNTFLADRCVAQRDYEPLYSDDDHLSMKGAELLSQYIRERLSPQADGGKTLDSRNGEPGAATATGQ